MDNISKRIATIRHSFASMGHTDSGRSTHTTIQHTKHYLDPIEPKLSLSTNEIERMYAKVFLATNSIHTPRLEIRKLRLSDSVDIYTYSKDERVAQHVLWTTHKNIEQSANYIRYLLAQYRTGLPASMGIKYKESGKIIGTIGFMKIDIDHSSAEIGYSLKYDMWNKGIMTEALIAMLKFGFFQLGLNRIEAFCELDNPASARILEKVGMSFEGVVRQKFYNKNRFVDVKQYAVLFYDYKERYKYEI